LKYTRWPAKYDALSAGCSIVTRGGAGSLSIATESETLKPLLSVAVAVMM
jgi:hypothetical protein